MVHALTPAEQERLALSDEIHRQDLADTVGEPLAKNWLSALDEESELAVRHQRAVNILSSLANTIAHGDGNIQSGESHKQAYKLYADWRSLWWLPTKGASPHPAWKLFKVLTLFEHLGKPGADITSARRVAGFPDRVWAALETGAMDPAEPSRDLFAWVLAWASALEGVHLEQVRLEVAGIAFDTELTDKRLRLEALKVLKDIYEPPPGKGGTTVNLGVNVTLNPTDLWDQVRKSLAETGRADEEFFAPVTIIDVQPEG